MRILFLLLTFFRVLVPVCADCHEPLLVPAGQMDCGVEDGISPDEACCLEVCNTEIGLAHVAAPAPVFIQYLDIFVPDIFLPLEFKLQRACERPASEQAHSPYSNAPRILRC